MISTWKTWCAAPGRRHPHGNREAPPSDDGNHPPGPPRRQQRLRHPDPLTDGAEEQGSQRPESAQGPGVSADQAAAQGVRSQELDQGIGHSQLGDQGISQRHQRNQDEWEGSGDRQGNQRGGEEQASQEKLSRAGDRLAANGEKDPCH